MNYTVKKITALLTAFVLVLCMGISLAFAEEGEESIVKVDSVALQKAETLKALGVLPASVTAEDFCLKEGVTRAEIASAMVKMSGVENSAAENTTVYFTDVDDESEYAADIAAALSMGIINGNGDYTFAPDEFITYEALVKMAVATLGYDTQAQLEGGFPLGYVQMAARIGLSNSVPGTVNGSFVAEFLYSMLDIDVSYITAVGEEVIYTTTEGRTLLTENLKMYTTEGVVTGNKSTDLYGMPMLSDGQISIDSVTYNYAGVSMDFVGKSVKAYCREDDGKSNDDVVYIEVSDRNRVITVDAEDTSYSDGVFSYYDANDKKRTASMYEGAAIIYNGRAITDTSFDMSRLVPEEGVITLIDNRSAGNYNVVMVNAYTNVVVEAVDTYHMVIYDKYTSTRNIQLDGKDYEIYDGESGAELTLSDISEYNVLTVMESDDDSFIIKRSTATVGGTIERTASNPEKIYIDGALYRFSNSYLTSGQEMPAAGDSGTFLLDINGRIAGKRTSRDSSIKVGLVEALTLETGLTTVPIIKMMTMLGEEQVYYFADLVEVDGVKIKSEETNSSGANKLVSEISKGTYGYSERLAAEIPDGQIIRYTLNSENKINMVDTVNRTEGVEGENTLRRSLKYEDGLGSGSGLYFKSKNANGKEIVSNETITFVVTLPFSGRAEDDITVSAGSYFTNSNFIIESYIYTEDKVGADVVICYKDQAASVLDSYAQEILVDSVGEAIGKDGSLQTQINGWYIGSYSSFLLKENAKIDFEIQKGDLIGFSTDAAGEIYLADHIYSARDDKYTMTAAYRQNNVIQDSNTMNDFYYANGAGTFDNGRVFTYGYLYHKFENDIVISKTENITETAMADTSVQTKVNIGSAYIYVYDKNDTRSPVRLGSKADLISYKNDNKNPSRIIVRASEALAKTVLIIK